jgi:RNA recognition motif-containing protein
MTIKLYVGNLPHGIKALELLTIFSGEGSVDSVSLVADDSDASRSRDFGFVVMVSQEDGLRAIKALNGFVVGGQPLEVKLAEPLRKPSRKFDFSCATDELGYPSPLGCLGFLCCELDRD